MHIYIYTHYVKICKGIWVALLSSQVQLKTATSSYPGLSVDKWTMYAYICAGLKSVLCVGLSLCYVWEFVCVMCSL